MGKSWVVSSAIGEPIDALADDGDQLAAAAGNGFSHDILGFVLDLICCVDPLEVGQVGRPVDVRQH